MSRGAAWAEIDLAAIRHNLHQVSERLPDNPIMAVVKANAYGHELSLVLGALGRAEAVAVARVDEGLAVRQLGFSGRVTVLEGPLNESELKLAEQHRLDLVIHSEPQLQWLISGHFTGLYTWLKMDTGMHRLGFRPACFRQAYDQLQRHFGHGPGLMTHLACADEPAKPDTEQQMQRFEHGIEGLQGELSLANSAAIIGWPERCAGWLRPGIMLYGISPFANNYGADLGLRPAMTFRTRIIAVREIEAGESVGYGSTWTATKPTRLATAAVGYGDGYPGNLPSGTPLLVNGRPAQLAGRVSMDMITLQVDQQAGIDDVVTLWGEGLPVEDIARSAGRIAYELVCGVSQRVPRLQVSS